MITYPCYITYISLKVNLVQDHIYPLWQHIDDSKTIRTQLVIQIEARIPQPDNPLKCVYTASLHHNYITFWKEGLY